ncbi:MAG: glycogen/starch synthase [Hyphomicrobiales bacterium]
MKKARVLFVAQEITPYLEETSMSRIGRYLPQGIQEKGKEIRTFMPRFGHINERRNQLHEVIRLSGMNLIINDSDHPLIIKVASIQQARMQVYFIDNEEYFHKKITFREKSGKFCEDNDERAIFFARGVLETVKKLGWAPDIIHCHGWFTGLVPLYVKKLFKDNPIFSESKIVFSAYDDQFEEKFNPNFVNKLSLDGIDGEDIDLYKEGDYQSILKGAISFSDAAIIGNENVNEDIKSFVENSGKPYLGYQDEESYISAYNDLYDQILSES